VTLDAGLVTALERFAAQPRVLVALDFDGVLAPIVAEPSAARPLPESAAALRELVGLDGVTLALVSGRALASLREVADPPPGAVLVASHGAELAGAAPPEVPRELLARVTSALEQVVATHPGTAVEYKPAATVLHTRRATSRPVAADATAAALAAVGAIDGAHVLQGKEVVEVSVVQADKGTALLGLVERLAVDAVLYVGDDTTDEHAFAAVARRAGAADVTVKVGEGDTAAAYRVGSPTDVPPLLRVITESRRHR
jgi:trehalose-phosphatase